MRKFSKQIFRIFAGFAVYAASINFVFCAENKAKIPTKEDAANLLFYTGFCADYDFSELLAKEPSYLSASENFIVGVVRLRVLGQADKLTNPFADFEKSANAGDPYGKAALAYCLREGIEKPVGISVLNNTELEQEKIKLSAKLLNEASAKGVMFASRLVGENLLKSKNSLEKSAGLEIIKSCADSGDAYAMALLASAYERGLGNLENAKEAQSLLNKSADLKNGVALYALGKLAQKEKKSEQLAFFYFENSANTNYPNGIYEFARCYLFGLGVNADYDKAFTLLKKASGFGAKEAWNLLGICYASGVGTEENQIQAFEHFRRGADEGDAEAQNNLGNYYYFGKNVAEDIAQAAKWFERAANQGNAAAQSSLAIIYLEEKIAGKSAYDAIPLLHKAALAGDPEAQSNLGKCYFEGIGTKQDLEEAVKWFTKAAAEDDAQALGNLGACYYLGKGVPKDESKGIEMIKKAAELGNEDAQKAYKRITVNQ